MRNFGVKVRLIEKNCFGYIIRRLNADAYEIATEDDVVLVLSPEEFEEIDSKREENDHE